MGSGFALLDQIKLENGFGRCAGRVEIFHQNRSGRVCDDNWDSRPGEVVCRQLNCGVVLSAPGNGAFGFGTSDYWLDDVNCNGTEAMLSACRARPWGQHDCGPSESASVVCSGDLPKPNIVISTNSSAQTNLICTLPPLHQNTTVYFYHTGKPDPMGTVPLPAQGRVAVHDITGAEASTRAGYQCQYEVKAARSEQLFNSAKSDTATVEGVGSTQGPLIPTTGESTSITGSSQGAQNASTYGRPLNEGLRSNITVIVASSVISLVVLAVVVAVLIFIYRKRRSGDPFVKKAETTTGNINNGQFKGELKRPTGGTRGMLKDSPSEAANYVNHDVLGEDDDPCMPHVYEKITHPNLKSGSPEPGTVYGLQSHTQGGSVRYETMLTGSQTFSPDSSKADPNIYQALCKDTVGDCVYETLNV